MIDAKTRLRNELLNTEVITRDTGKKLGVVKEVLVDIDRREVVALGLRSSRFALSGIPKYMYLDSIAQMGDVILVENEDVIEDIDIDLYTPLINSEVVTETGEPLGRVRDFQFDPKTGELHSLIIAAIGYPQIPEQLISTYEISVDEIVSSGPNRIIVFEGAQERVTQLTVGILEKLGIGRPPWEKDEEETYYAPTTPPENQLPAPIPVKPVAKPVPKPAIEENWAEEEWEEEEVVNTPPPRQVAKAVSYEEETEEENWGAERIERESSRDYTPPAPQSRPRNDDDYSYDVWE
ncbi:MAG TPA: PRC-barrel domain-containing protein, partial [Geminocystis sp. M7585_C2015_104]|nr:PRC-barrel domain-containing protein [Geminocystis sp. M7585_C2015_104]